MITAQQIKAYVKQLGGDLVGISPVERFKNAPIRISPQGHLPTAQSVIVAAIHTPDGAWELGGEPIHNWGSASVVTAVNSRLERIGFYVARLLEENGYRSIPIPQTAIWRYRPYEDLNIIFSPDLSHIHAAAAAGLGDIGFNGLLLTPEYGARERLMTIITEAVLDPDPLYAGEVLCDRCMECVKQCAPSSGLRKEVDGITRVDIGGKIFEYANKNKFRCAWAERFQIKFDMDIPDKVDENVIVPNLACNREGYGSSLEPCWRYCLPPYLRTKKESRKPNHRKSFWVQNPDIDPQAAPEARALTMEMENIAFSKGVELFGVASAERFDNLQEDKSYKLNLIPHPFNEKWGTVGINPRKYLQDVKSVIVLGIGYADECLANKKVKTIDTNEKSPEKPSHLIVSGIAFMDEYKSSGSIPVVEAAIKEKIMDSLLDITRHLEEKGYSAVGLTYLADNYAALACGLGDLNEQGDLVTADYGTNQIYTAILTSAPLQEVIGNFSAQSADAGTTIKLSVSANTVKAYAAEKGAKLVGIASAESFKGIKKELAKLYDEKACGLSVADQNERMGGKNVQAEIKQKEHVFKDPWDYLEDAKSVIVIGTNIPQSIIERAEKPPAESVGVYSMYAQHTAWRILDEMAFDIVKMLNAKGYKAVPTEDLNGTASKVAHTFGEMVDARANAYAAMLAGLGEVSWSGNPVTNEYGQNQRFFAIVTNADLKADDLYSGSAICTKCKRCVPACTVNAISKDGVKLNIGGITIEQGKMDVLCCDWSKRYGMIADEGPKFMGSQTNIMPPKVITGEAIVEAMKKMDPLQKRIPCIVENCILKCPLSGRE